MKRAPALVLFDIDGTLLRRAGPHHRQALVDAIRGVLKVETTTDGIPVQGMLDREIMARMLREVGVKESTIKTAMPALVTRAQWIYQRNCAADLRDKVCPGAPDLLRALHRHDIPAVLVSGNLSRIGWKKMALAGLKRYFRAGSFAERAQTRAELAAQAIRNAKARGWISLKTRISLIGDHPNDVNAAKLNGIRSIAVATGLSPYEELSAMNPDILLDNLCNLRLEQLL
ncbi:MAG: HAD family hydrolase [Acidobacteria bacterium]|nr:HAD family hydrolase [Acidobacteriota bacterium]